jgi:hypothetical protein
MNVLVRLVCCFIFLSLVSCVSQKHMTVKTQDVKQCKVMCVKRFESCNTLCVNNCAVCSEHANQSTLSSYSEYVHQQQVKGGFVARGLKSYRDPLQCRKVTCNCYADLMICEQDCTGIIQKQVRAVPNCT